MNRVKDFISNIELDEGQTYRGNCPQCNGKNTFTVTNDTGNIIYNCYKAGCRVAGASRRDLDAYTIKARLAQGYTDSDKSYQEAASEPFELPPYLLQASPTDPAVEDFMKKWDINYDDVLYDIRQSRLVFPIRNEQNVLVDAVGRSLTNRQPKWLRYASSPVPYVCGAGTVAVIVEDAISAYTVGKLFDAVGIALLGTQLTEFHKWYIPQVADRIVIALDPDALDKTIKMVGEMRVHMDDVKGINLNDDIKYRQERDLERLEELLYGYN